MKNLKPRKVVLFGNGQMACFAHTVLTNDSPHEVVAFTVDGAYITERTVLGLPVVPFEDIERSARRKVRRGEGEGLRPRELRQLARAHVARPDDR